MKPKWIIFDLGGVILDWHSCRDETLKYLKIDLEKFNPIFLKYLPSMENGLIAPQDGFKGILNDLKIMENSQKVYDMWVSHLKPITSTFNLISQLEKHYQLAACTNNWIGLLDKNRQMFPSVFENFKFFVDSSKEKIRKPDRRIYQKVETLSKSSGEDIYFLDDSAENIKGAASLDWQTHLFDFKTDGGIKSCQQIRKLLL